MSGARSTPQEWKQARVIGAAIRTARLRAHLTQIELAARVRENGRPWQQADVSRTECGRSRLMLSTFVDVVRAIGGEPGRLLTRALKAEQSTEAGHVAIRPLDPSTGA